MHVDELQRRYKILHQRLSNEQLITSLLPHENTYRRRTDQGSICSFTSKATNGCIPTSITYQEETRGAPQVQHKHISGCSCDASYPQRQPDRSTNISRRDHGVRAHTFLERVLGSCIFYLKQLNVPRI